jgi:hypothetical protein
VPERVKDLPAFLEEIIRLLRLIEQCREVLFRRGFQSGLGEAIADATDRLRQIRDDRRIRYPDESGEMVAAGLAGRQLELKLESFEADVVAFEAEGGEDLLADALDKASTILRSIAGAIPGIGSFAEELIAFILKELKRKWRFWRR